MNASGAIKAIVGANTAANAVFAGRVFPIVAPQGSAFPFAVVRVVGVDPANSKTNTSDVDKITVEAAIWADTVENMRNAQGKFRTAIDGFRGDVSTVAGSEIVAVDGIVFNNYQEYFNNDTDGSAFYCVEQYTVRIKRIGSAGPGGPVGPVGDIVGNWLNTLDDYTDDSAAALGGVAVGEWYILSDSNFYGIPGGLLKKRTF